MWVCEYVRVCACVREYVRVCACVREYVHVCACTWLACVYACVCIHVEGFHADLNSILHVLFFTGNRILVI